MFPPVSANKKSVEVKNQLLVFKDVESYECWKQFGST